MSATRELYLATLRLRGYASDAAQLRAVDALERCELQWLEFEQRRRGAISRWFGRSVPPQGVYMYGGVGRGKSLLMDCFYQAIGIEQKTRLHFHEFMREVHRQLKSMQGSVNPLDILADGVSQRYRLICFDEFHVADITDAMILHRVLQALFERGVGIVTTSNFHPDGLYPNGLHRDRILPAIELLKQRMEVVEVDGGKDYRQLGLIDVPRYLTPADAAAQARLQAVFDRVAETADESPELTIEGRVLRAYRRAGGVVWFDFRTLCGTARSQNDYLELATRFHTLVVSEVPQMTPSMASEARRFTLLVDVLYDRRVKLFISAAVPPQSLYISGPLAHEFPRTVSRLQEMQTAEFAALQRRQVDTSLT